MPSLSKVSKLTPFKVPLLIPSLNSFKSFLASASSIEWFVSATLASKAVLNFLILSLLLSDIAYDVLIPDLLNLLIVSASFLEFLSKDSSCHIFSAFSLTSWLVKSLPVDSKSSLAACSYFNCSSLGNKPMFIVKDSLKFLLANSRAWNSSNKDCNVVSLFCASTLVFSLFW